MKKIFFLSWVLLSINGCGQVGQNPAIDSIFSDMNESGVPGCALGIIQDGELVYSKGYGMANLEYDIPNAGNTVFRIGSTSKQFTAACIVLLAESGKLNLDDRLSTFFPDFPAYADQVTVRHLLHHTSGIRDYLTLASLKGLGEDDFYTDREVMKLLVNQMELNFNPGDEYLYSNSGYWLLGQIVNKVSGMNMADFARQEIFEPLGMTSTHFHNDHARIVKNRASGYAPDGAGGFEISMTTLDMIGDGGVFTTVEDIKKWDDAFYGSDILGESFWSTMLECGILNSGDTLDYACGLQKGNYRGLKTISHGGAFVGYRADILRFPEQRFSVVVFANRADVNPSSLCTSVADVMLKELLVEQEYSGENMAQSDPIPEIIFRPEQLTGIYRFRPGLTIEIRQQNDSLYVIQSWNPSPYKIIRTTGNTFQNPEYENISFTFLELEDGKTSLLSVLQGSQEIRCTRMEQIDLGSVNIEAYAGKYYSRELDIIYELTVGNDMLQLSVGDHDPEEITAYEKDQFSRGYSLLRFQRTGNTIAGFELDAGRVKNLKFEKL